MSTTVTHTVQTCCRQHVDGETVKISYTVTLTVRIDYPRMRGAVWAEGECTQLELVLIAFVTALTGRSVMISAGYVCIMSLRLYTCEQQYQLKIRSRVA